MEFHVKLLEMIRAQELKGEKKKEEAPPSQTRDLNRPVNWKRVMDAESSSIESPAAKKRRLDSPASPQEQSTDNNVKTEREEESTVETAAVAPAAPKAAEVTITAYQLFEGMLENHTDPDSKMETLTTLIETLQRMKEQAQVEQQPTSTTSADDSSRQSTTDAAPTVDDDVVVIGETAGILDNKGKTAIIGIAETILSSPPSRTLLNSHSVSFNNTHPFSALPTTSTSLPAGAASSSTSSSSTLVAPVRPGNPNISRNKESKMPALAAAPLLIPSTSSAPKQNQAVANQLSSQDLIFRNQMHHQQLMRHHFEMQQRNVGAAPSQRSLPTTQQLQSLQTQRMNPTQKQQREEEQRRTLVKLQKEQMAYQKQRNEELKKKVIDSIHSSHGGAATPEQMAELLKLPAFAILENGRYTQILNPFMQDPISLNGSAMPNVPQLNGVSPMRAPPMIVPMSSTMPLRIGSAAPVDVATSTHLLMPKMQMLAPNMVLPAAQRQQMLHQHNLQHQQMQAMQQAKMQNAMKEQQKLMAAALSAQRGMSLGSQILPAPSPSPSTSHPLLPVSSFPTTSSSPYSMPFLTLPTGFAPISEANPISSNSLPVMQSPRIITPQSPFSSTASSPHKPNLIIDASPRPCNDWSIVSLPLPTKLHVQCDCFQNLQ